MRRNRQYSVLTILVALAFPALWPVAAQAEEAGGLWRLLLGDSSQESAEHGEKAHATHEQAEMVKITATADSTALPLHDFCLNTDGNILAGVGGEPGEIRILDSDGKYLATWSVPIKVEAVGIAQDGHVYVGGSGKLLKLDGEGKVVREAVSPHIATFETNQEAIREELVKQYEQQAKMLGQQLKTYEKRIDQLQEKIGKQEEEIEALDALMHANVESAEGETDMVEDAGVSAVAGKPEGDGEKENTNGVEQKKATPPIDQNAIREKQSIARRLLRDKRMLKAFQNGLESIKEYAEQTGGGELTDAQIDAQVKRMLQRKQKISSISAAGEDVFVTCLATVGHGFDIWRMDQQFENAKKIVEGLSGCCGQMDARGGPDGLYVAENGRHRVCKYDREGELLKTWGKGARKGLRGFGGCCNPKNVAFGPQGEVYTVEDTSGRVKHYSPDGELLGLVGTVQIGDGCLDISIAVSASGDRVYVLDTDADRIVILKRKNVAEESPNHEEAGGG